MSKLILLLLFVFLFFIYWCSECNDVCQTEKTKREQLIIDMETRKKENMSEKEKCYDICKNTFQSKRDWWATEKTLSCM